jgi:hypothetical protein
MRLQIFAMTKIFGFGGFFGLATTADHHGRFNGVRAAAALHDGLFEPKLKIAWTNQGKVPELWQSLANAIAPRIQKASESGQRPAFDTFQTHSDDFCGPHRIDVNRHDFSTFPCAHSILRTDCRFD